MCNSNPNLHSWIEGVFYYIESKQVNSPEVVNWNVTSHNWQWHHSVDTSQLLIDILQLTHVSVINNRLWCDLQFYPEHTKGLILMGDLNINHLKDIKAARNNFETILKHEPYNIQVLTLYFIRHFNSPFLWTMLILSIYQKV